MSSLLIPLVGHLRLISVKRSVFVGLALIYAMLASSTGVMRRLDNAIVDLRFHLSPVQSVQDSVIVAIDTKSLQAHRDWPWSRDMHAQLIERLNDAGARHIAFDVDFSSPRDGDEALAAAIAGSHATVYLAAFRQAFDSVPGLVAEIRPSPHLAQNAVIASTMYQTDPDGVVRRLPAGEVFSDGFVPQLAYALNNHHRPARERRVDVAIDVAGLPVISFVDVLSGAPIEHLVRGRTVFVGATATELGDEFVLPVHGLQSGVLLNVLAHETIKQGGALSDAPPAPFLILVFLAAVVSMAPLSRLGMWRYGAANVGVFALIALTGFGAQAFFDSVLPTGEAHIAQLVGVLLVSAAAADRVAAQNFRAQMDTRGRAQLMDAIMTSNHDGIITVRHTGHVENCNERAANLLGLAQDDILGALVTEVAPNLASYAEGGEGNEPVPLISPCGDTRFVHVSCVEVAIPVESSRYERRRSVRQKHVYTLHDVTNQQRAAQAERDAKEMHARASQAKTALLNTMSHELRTPLNAIIGFADILAQPARHAHGPEQQAEFGASIRSSGKQLLNIVNDMLLATRFQSRDITPAPRWIDADELVEAALGRAQAQMSWTAPKVTIDVEDIELDVDADLATVALRHLIDNAAKYSGSKGSIAVSGAVDGACFCFCVEDDGPGMPETALGALKGAFAQADGAITRSHGGCGLGLYLVNRIAIALGGELTLSSPPGGGFRAEMTCSLEAGRGERSEPRLVA